MSEDRGMHLTAEILRSLTSSVEANWLATLTRRRRSSVNVGPAYLKGIRPLTKDTIDIRTDSKTLPWPLRMMELDARSLVRTPIFSRLRPDSIDATIPTWRPRAARKISVEIVTVGAIQLWIAMRCHTGESTLANQRKVSSTTTASTIEVPPINMSHALVPTYLSCRSELCQTPWLGLSK